MKDELLNLLVCPACKGPLEYHAETNELVCRHDRLAFPLRDGVPVLLMMDARALDDAVDNSGK
jgi:uncharacterized protein YbaR (Trm112 family)